MGCEERAAWEAGVEARALLEAAAVALPSFLLRWAARGPSGFRAETAFSASAAAAAGWGGRRSDCASPSSWLPTSHRGRSFSRCRPLPEIALSSPADRVGATAEVAALSPPS